MSFENSCYAIYIDIIKFIGNTQSILDPIFPIKLNLWRCQKACKYLKSVVNKIKKLLIF